MAVTSEAVLSIANGVRNQLDSPSENLNLLLSKFFNSEYKDDRQSIYDKIRNKIIGLSKDSVSVPSRFYLQLIKKLVREIAVDQGAEYLNSLLSLLMIIALGRKKDVIHIGTLEVLIRKLDQVATIKALPSCQSIILILRLILCLTGCDHDAQQKSLEAGLFDSVMKSLAMFEAFMQDQEFGDDSETSEFQTILDHSIAIFRSIWFWKTPKNDLELVRKFFNWISGRMHLFGNRPQSLHTALNITADMLKGGKQAHVDAFFDAKLHQVYFNLIANMSMDAVALHRETAFQNLALAANGSSEQKLCILNLRDFTTVCHDAVLRHNIKSALKILVNALKDGSSEHAEVLMKHENSQLLHLILWRLKFKNTMHRIEMVSIVVNLVKCCQPSQLGQLLEMGIIDILALMISDSSNATCMAGLTALSRMFAEASRVRLAAGGVCSKLSGLGPIPFTSSEAVNSATQPSEKVAKGETEDDLLQKIRHAVEAINLYKILEDCKQPEAPFFAEQLVLEIQLLYFSY